jgi:hypothetical protein
MSTSSKTRKFGETVRRGAQGHMTTKCDTKWNPETEERYQVKTKKM